MKRMKHDSFDRENEGMEKRYTFFKSPNNKEEKKSNCSIELRKGTQL
jgi:hypothetical protein